MEKKGDSIVLVERGTEGKSPEGRNRMEWMNNIKIWEGKMGQAYQNGREHRGPMVH